MEVIYVINSCFIHYLLRLQKITSINYSSRNYNYTCMWRLWARALGEKIGATKKEADAVARFRTIIVAQAVITNILIAVNIIINWLKN